MNQRFNFQAQIEHLHSSYPGAGHPDMTKWEFNTNVHRDTFASHIAHYDRMLFFATAQNQPVERLRVRMLQGMVRPCGPPPPESVKKGSNIFQSE